MDPIGLIIAAAALYLLMAPILKKIIPLLSKSNDGESWTGESSGLVYE